MLGNKELIKSYLCLFLPCFLAHLNSPLNTEMCPQQFPSTSLSENISIKNRSVGSALGNVEKEEPWPTFPLPGRRTQMRTMYVTKCVKTKQFSFSKWVSLFSSMKFYVEEIYIFD